MAGENPSWGKERIANEILLKLGLVGKARQNSCVVGYQARQLLDSIDLAELYGLRDRALIGVMVYSLARVSAAATLRVEDYFERGRRVVVAT